MPASQDDDDDDDNDDDDDDDDGYPAYSHHDKIPPWWEMSVMMKVGICQCQNSTIHHTPC